MNCCPRCGYSLEAPSTLAQLRDWCQRNGRHVAPDESVDEATAAEIVDRSPGTLTNWRAQGIGPPYRRIGRTGRVRYPLAGIAAYLDDATITND